jgi:hypothetical protein
MSFNTKGPFAPVEKEMQWLSYEVRLIAVPGPSTFSLLTIAFGAGLLSHVRRKHTHLQTITLSRKHFFPSPFDGFVPR